MISCAGAGTRARPLAHQQLYCTLPLAHAQLSGTAVDNVGRMLVMAKNLLQVALLHKFLHGSVNFMIDLCRT